MSAAEFITKNPIARFVSRPWPVPGENRLVWRMALLVVVLELAGRGGSKTMSLLKLHALCWATKSPQTLDSLDALLSNQLEARSLGVSIDPFLNSALDVAIAEKLVTQAKSNLGLSNDGRLFAQEIIAEQMLKPERTAIQRIKGRATEATLKRVLGLTGG